MANKISPAKIRTKVMTFIIYPDNPLQMDFFRYCWEHERIIYIKHIAEKKVKLLVQSGQLIVDNQLIQDNDVNHDFKEHLHVMIMFDNQRTVQAFVNSSCGSLSYAQAVSDRISMLRYFMHDTYACYRDCKERYTLEDIKTNDLSFFDSCLGKSVVSRSSNVAQLVDLSNKVHFSSFSGLVAFLVDNQLTELLEFCISHPYFVKNSIRFQPSEQEVKQKVFYE